MSVMVCDRRSGCNPKVSTLAALLPAARHEHVRVSDSNVRVGPDDLRETAAELAGPRVGLVTNVASGSPACTSAPTARSTSRPASSQA